MAYQERRIIGIAPATGWYAVYALDEPDENGRLYVSYPLALWALVESNGSTFVDGIDMWGTDAAFGLCLCSESSNFLGYATEDTFDHQFWTNIAREFLKNRQV